MNRHTDKIRRHSWQRTRRPRHWSPVGFHGAPVAVTQRPVIEDRCPATLVDALEEYDEFVRLTVNSKGE